jgi:hypothetical protein
MSEQTPAQQADQLAQLASLMRHCETLSEVFAVYLERIEALEAGAAALRAAVSPQAQEKIRSFWCPHCLSDFEVSGDIRAALEDAKAHELQCEKNPLKIRAEKAEAELAAMRVNEGEKFRELSRLLTNGNAGTWEELSHAAESRAAVSGEGTWQPIATAPKDADLLLLCGPLDGVRSGYWDDDSHQWMSVETKGLTGGWMTPTLWQPMPAAPQGGQPVTTRTLKDYRPQHDDDCAWEWHADGIGNVDCTCGLDTLLAQPLAGEGATLSGRAETPQEEK